MLTLRAEVSVGVRAEPREIAAALVRGRADFIDGVAIACEVEDVDMVARTGDTVDDVLANWETDRDAREALEMNLAEILCTGGGTP